MDCNYLLSDDPDIYFLPAGANNPQGFWRRQFGDRPTGTQFNFDVTFGLVLPVLCFVFDPGIFHRWLDADAGIFVRGRLFVYCASAVEMATLACWLFAGPRLGAWSRPAGGVMTAGGIFSLLVGLLILPFSVLGIFVGGLGLLGFIPFVTAVVYLRNGARSLRHGRVRRPVRGAALLALLFGLFVVLGPAAAAQSLAVRAVDAAVEDVLAGRELSPLRRGTTRALWLASAAGSEGLASKYRSTTDKELKARVEAAYVVVTGRSIRWHGGGWLDDY